MFLLYILLKLSDPYFISLQKIISVQLLNSLMTYFSVEIKKGKAIICDQSANLIELVFSNLYFVSWLLVLKHFYFEKKSY
jgi:hypothetical protein